MSEITRLVVRVRDLDTVVAYYTDVLGLTVDHRDPDGALLVTGGGAFGLELRAAPDAPLRPYPCRGLYHFALLVPDRPALGAVLRRVHEVGAPFEGMADHAVSEALYLRDPEGNGIELYRDRPRDDWPYRDGQLVMVADPLDVSALLAAGPRAAPLHPDTVIGHVHMHVDDLDEAEGFYAGTLGMTVTQRSYRGARFFAWDDYHHHVGTNLWAPKGEVDPAATGLLSYAVRTDDAALDALLGDVDRRGVPKEGHRLTDPTGVWVELEPDE